MSNKNDRIANNGNSAVTNSVNNLNRNASGIRGYSGMQSLMEALQRTSGNDGDNNHLNFLSTMNHHNMINSSRPNNSFLQQTIHEPSNRVGSMDSMKMSALLPQQQTLLPPVTQADISGINNCHFDQNTKMTLKLNNQPVATKKKKKSMPKLPTIPTEYTEQAQKIPSLPLQQITKTAPYFLNLPNHQNLRNIPLKKRSKMSHTSGGSSVCSSSASSTIFSDSKLQQPFNNSMAHHHFPNKIVLNQKNKANDDIEANDKKKQRLNNAPSSPNTTSYTTKDSLTTSISTKEADTGMKANKEDTANNDILCTSKISVSLNHYKVECNSILKRCLVLAGYNANESKKGQDMLTFYFAARAIYDDIQRWKRLKSFFVQCQETKDLADMSKLKEQQRAVRDSSLNNFTKFSDKDNDLLGHFSDATTKTATTNSTSVNEIFPHNQNDDTNILSKTNVRYPETTTNANNNTTPLHLLSNLLSSYKNNDNVSNQDREDLSSINNETVTTTTTTYSTKNGTVNSEFTKQLEDIDTVSEISNFESISELESKNSFLGRFRNVTSSINDNKSVGSKSGSSRNKGNSLIASVSRSNRKQPHGTASHQQNKKSYQESSVSSSILQWDTSSNKIGANEMHDLNKTSTSSTSSKKSNNLPTKDTSGDMASIASSNQKSIPSIDHRAQEWKSEFLSMIEDHGDTILSDLMTFSES